MKNATLFLFCFAAGVLPVSAQTAASLSGVVMDEGRAALPDVPAASGNAGAGAVNAGTEGMYKLSPAGAGMHQAYPAGQAPAQPQTSEPATAPPASDALTWHGITLYGAYDIGVLAG